LIGQNPFVREFSEKYKVPLLGALGGPETTYPEFLVKLKDPGAAEAAAKAKLLPSGPQHASRAADPDPHDGEIHALQVQGNVYMLLGDGGNIAVQVGDQGPLVVDTGAGQLSDKVIAAIRKLKGGTFVDSIVAEHVVNLQFRYLLNKTDPNGFVPQPTGLVAPADLLTIREVEATIGVETVRAVNAVTNSNSISTGCGASANGKQTICSTTATTVRNLQFRKAL
jgi:hypothetical protein